MNVTNYNDLTGFVNESKTYPAPVLKATRDLARTKPWEGSFDKRMKDFRNWFRAVAAHCDLEGWEIVHVGGKTGCSGQSTLVPELHRITLTGRLSVVTMMHLFAKARFGANSKRDHVKAIAWSVNLFRRKFPISFGRCKMIGGILVNDGRRND